MRIRGNSAILLVDPDLQEKVTKIESPTDPEYLLLQRIANQDRQAFQQLYLNYHERLYRFMMRMLNQPEQVEELVDDVLLVVWQKAGTFKGQSKVSTWIMGIANNKALKAYRQNKKASQRSGSADMLEQIPDQTDNQPEARLAQQKISATIQEALEKINTEQRSVVELTLLGYSYPEIAKIVNCPVNTVKTRMFHARQLMKSKLTRVFSDYE